MNLSTNRINACVLSTLLFTSTLGATQPKGRDQRPTHGRPEIETAVMAKINVLSVHLKQGTAKAVDLEAAATGLQLLTEIYKAEGTFKLMDAEIKKHHQDILNFVPNEETTTELQLHLRTRGLNVSREEIFQAHTKPYYDKQLSLQRMEENGMQFIFEATIKEMSQQAASLRSGRGIFVQSTSKYSLCDMMGDVSGGMGIAALFGCIPCGFASGIAFGFSVGCRIHDYYHDGPFRF